MYFIYICIFANGKLKAILDVCNTYVFLHFLTTFQKIIQNFQHLDDDLQCRKCSKLQIFIHWFSGVSFGLIHTSKFLYTNFQFTFGLISVQTEEKKFMSSFYRFWWKIRVRQYDSIGKAENVVYTINTWFIFYGAVFFFHPLERKKTTTTINLTLSNNLFEILLKHAPPKNYTHANHCLRLQNM